MPKKVRTNFDGAWKTALEQFFEPAIAFFRPQIHAAIDWNQPITFLDDELRQIMRGGPMSAPAASTNSSKCTSRTVARNGS
ncbi:MAG: hypothetical protein IPK16_00645 [Anaerolineales bacterium]|nr:hypothetical protein [Anaerolineales bacterium]